MSGISVTPADAGDMEALGPLIEEIGAQADSGPAIAVDPAEVTQRLAEDGPGGEGMFECLIAKIEGTVAGFALFSRTYDLSKPGNGLSLRAIYVAQAERKKGAGKALLAHLAGIACEMSPDAPRMEWHAERLDLDIRAFYDMAFPDGFKLNTLSYSAEGDEVRAVAEKGGR